VNAAEPQALHRVRAALTSLPGVLLVVVALTVLCRVETTNAPWSPYFFAFGALALLVPLVVGVAPIRATKIAGKALWKLTAATAAVAILIDSGVFVLAYDAVLQHLGLYQPFYSISSATNLMVETVAQRQHLSATAAMGIFGVMVLLWAPVAEELFYRGYVYGSLKRHLPLATAWGISVAVFGLRHVIHFFYLWPKPSVAGMVWAFSMLIFGSLMTWLYERTGGLGPSMVVHLLVNMAGVLAAPLP
jgi:membrane protease YdiL (CAAX protease family)